jgi:hypothetical protein
MVKTGSSSCWVSPHLSQALNPVGVWWDNDCSTVEGWPQCRKILSLPSSPRAIDDAILWGLESREQSWSGVLWDPAMETGWKIAMLLFLGLSSACDQTQCHEHMGECLASDPCHIFGQWWEVALNLATPLSCLNIEDNSAHTGD